MRISGRKHFIGGLVIGFAILGAVPRSAAQQAITPTAKELNRAFDADASQWTARFEHEGRAIYDKRYEILDAMHLKPGMNAADIGAGSGLFARLMAQRVAPGGTVYAVDIFKNMIDYITKMATQEKIANLNAVLGAPHFPGWSRARLIWCVSSTPTIISNSPRICSVRSVRRCGQRVRSY
jgi:predicted methyltransferase